jgi:hypothetical protein
METTNTEDLQSEHNYVASQAAVLWYFAVAALVVSEAFFIALQIHQQVKPLSPQFWFAPVFIIAPLQVGIETYRRLRKLLAGEVERRRLPTISKSIAFMVLSPNLTVMIAAACITVF